MTQTAINTHNMRIEFGKHKGELWTRVPVSYLKWIVNERARDNDIAQAELDRRGTVTPDCDVSGHAIDRASLNCRKIWHQTKNKGEGLHAWLVRMTEEALAAEEMHKGKYRIHGMLLAIENDGCWPVLKTVIRED